MLASNGRGAGMHVNPLEQVFVFTPVLTISELLYIYIVLFYPAFRTISRFVRALATQLEVPALAQGPTSPRL